MKHVDLFAMENPQQPPVSARTVLADTSLSGLLLRNSRRGSLPWIFHCKKVLVLSVLISVVGCGPGRPHLQTLQLNRDGNSALKGQTYPAAMEKYLEALRYDPFIGQLHLNLGLSFEGQQQAEKALQSYKEAEALAEKEKNLPLLFMARFNQAQLLGKAKKVDEALAMYQKALEIIPDSQETKTNIELLTQAQQGGGQGGQNQDQQQNQQDNKDQQQNQQNKNQDNKEQNKKDEPKEGPKQQSPKYKPRPFQGKELSEADVKKILGELKQQEEKIRAEYNRKEVKEQPRDKDW